MLAGEGIARARTPVPPWFISTRTGKAGEGARPTLSSFRCPPFFDRLQMLTQPVHHAITLIIVHLLLQFLQRKVDDIMVVNFLGRDVTAELKPDSVQQINLFGSEVRRVRTEIKNVLTATRRVNYQRQLRLGVSESLPGKSGNACFLRQRPVRRYSKHHHCRLQTLS